MSFSDSRRDTVPVRLPNGTTVKVEVAQAGREDVKFDVKSFQGVTDAIEGVLENQIEQGSLVAAIVRGTGKANLEITLE